MHSSNPIPTVFGGRFWGVHVGVGMNELSGMLDSGINSQCKQNMRIVWSTPRGGKYIECSTVKSRQFIRKSRKNHLLLFSDRYFILLSVSYPNTLIYEMIQII